MDTLRTTERLKRIFLATAAALGGLCLAGCDNQPSDGEVRKCVEDFVADTPMDDQTQGEYINGALNECGGPETDLFFVDELVDEALEG